LGNPVATNLLGFTPEEVIGKNVISYSIVAEKHGGSLPYFSILGKGTELMIQIPI
jgi:hypothetical protein